MAAICWRIHGRRSRCAVIGWWVEREAEVGSDWKKWVHKGRVGD